MKLISGTVLLALLAAVASQDTETTVTEELIGAQSDLTLSHAFAETLLSVNREQISSYMNRISRELITSHVDAYGNLKDQILETNEALDAFEVTERSEVCLNNVRNRWNLQVSRFVIAILIYNIFNSEHLFHQIRSTSCGLPPYSK